MANTVKVLFSGAPEGAAQEMMKKVEAANKKVGAAALFCVGQFFGTQPHLLRLASATQATRQTSARTAVQHLVCAGARLPSSAVGAQGCCGQRRLRDILRCALQARVITRPTQMTGLCL